MTLSDYLLQPKVTAVGIAKALKVSHSTVLRWAKNRVPADMIAPLSDLTGLSPSELRPDLAATFAHAGHAKRQAEVAA